MQKRLNHAPKDVKNGIEDILPLKMLVHTNIHMNRPLLKSQGLYVKAGQHCSRNVERPDAALGCGLPIEASRSELIEPEKSA